MKITKKKSSSIAINRIINSLPRVIYYSGSSCEETVDIGRKNGEVKRSPSNREKRRGEKRGELIKSRGENGRGGKNVKTEDGNGKSNGEKTETERFKGEIITRYFFQ